jgi:penicillin-binding protein 1A
MMRSVVAYGTGAKAGSLHMDIAGKTGTSNDARDAWFVGLTPEFAVGVWIGFDDFRRPLGGGESGSHTALPVYIDVMKVIGRRTGRFTKPEGVVEAVIDERTGLLAPPGAIQGIYTESFINGTVPVEIAPLPGEVDVQDFVTDEYSDPYAGGSDAGPVIPDGMIGNRTEDETEEVGEVPAQ